jgi:hypothetical protein
VHVWHDAVPKECPYLRLEQLLEGNIDHAASYEGLLHVNKGTQQHLHTASSTMTAQPLLSPWHAYILLCRLQLHEEELLVYAHCAGRPSIGRQASSLSPCATCVTLPAHPPRCKTLPVLPRRSTRGELDMALRTATAFTQ